MSEAIEKKLLRSLERLERARPYAKTSYQGPVIDLARRLLLQPDGIDRLYPLAGRLDAAGVFVGSDWDEPQTLLPRLVRNTLELGDPPTVVIECLSLLRALAIVEGQRERPSFPADAAREFLTKVLALNIDRVVGSDAEAERIRLGPLGPALDRLFQFLVNRLGFGAILGQLVSEIWRILDQRPIQVVHVKAMITRIALALSEDPSRFHDDRERAERLCQALFQPTETCAGDPGIAGYLLRVGQMDEAGLQREARTLGQSMHETGLVSDYHAAFLRWLAEKERYALVADTLGLSTTGRDVLGCYTQLTRRLIETAIFPETAQAVYGLAMLLERGILYTPSIGPSLWRHINLQLSPEAQASIEAIFGTAQPARSYLLASTLQLLGLPFGIGQGNNPTCQSARALSMWSYNDPDYLLHLIAQAASHNNVIMHFEGQPLHSSQLAASLIHASPADMDVVSSVVVPHLDRVYGQMGRLCVGREGDPHRWINPEFHGWWVGREFFIAVDVGTGLLTGYDNFLQHFYRNYHPYFNGGLSIIHPQPAGLAVTDSFGTYVGWHAISIIRVALDGENVMRCYFYNPNNDSGQNWGKGIIVSTAGNGERPGESSLPFGQLASRLYIFHADTKDTQSSEPLPLDEIEEVKTMAIESWAEGRVAPPEGSAPQG